VEKVQGFYPCGTYGSGPLLSVEERKRVAEVVIDEVNGRVPVIMHVGGASTRSVVELAKHAEKAGATAVAAVPPIYYGFKEPEVERHFKALVEAVSIPVFVYNNPKTTGVSQPLGPNRGPGGEGLELRYHGLLQLPVEGGEGGLHPCDRHRGADLPRSRDGSTCIGIRSGQCNP